MKPETFLDAKKAVGFLYCEELDAKGALIKKPIGTGFIASAEGPAVLSAYLVTAKHVYNDLLGGNGGIFFRVNRRQSGVRYIPLPEEGWIPHLDPNVDLTILPMLPILLSLAGKLEGMETHTISIEQIGAVQAYASSLGKPWPPQEMEEVFFAGLMLQHQGEERNFPVARTGRIALNTDELINLKPGRSRYRLIECQSYRGNSGAPVWVHYRDDASPCFLGVLAVAFPSESELVEGVPYLNTGISAVVPGEYLAEMLSNALAANGPQATLGESL